MLRFVIYVICIGVVWSRSDEEWQAFKNKHGKNYGSDEEENLRRQTWENNMNRADEHNGNGQHSFTVGENEYADLSTEEVKSTMNGLINDANQFGINFNSFLTTTAATTTVEPNLPDSVDWRKEGYVTAIKNQGQCGSCWSFSAAGALEGQYFKATGNLVNLSESNLVDCSTKFGDNGCNGGWYGDAFSYVQKKGIGSLASYPYVPKKEDCKYKESMLVTKCSSYVNVPAGEEPLKKAVATIGPISVAIDAGQWSFQMYQSGVYVNPNCTTKVDHAVMVVGYGTEKGQDYWLVKNSWGTSWGEDGYVKMARNLDDQCGISSCAAYPLI